ncbi:hypothetical protein BDB00DRAFT_471140 [Zychaea mexicana]|uniref:uncharacterized protein n=1 Tax=Zychaea mexicana TaxID=64656 RepID=UPI0022FE0EC2|nr:uncharacterized protein BDB00DRAFT_471140 [Zychaea mexicana]KAI9491747.1 hypothetical protein BDB00DRAFT_471140 [Zychaea mexicana]
MKEEEDDFNFFDDFSSDEALINNERRARMQTSLKNKLAKFSNDPLKRTTQENRTVFNRNRLLDPGHFQTPQKRQHVFTQTECNTILNQCRELTTTEWTTARHSAFPTTDIPIRDAIATLAYITDMVRERLFPQLASYFGFHPTRDLDFRDVFIVKYAADAQRGLKLHTDGCLVSFNILISHQDDFEGGGTYFESIDDDVHLTQGDCVFHDARIMHRGIDITRGARYILVGFVDTVDTLAKDKMAPKKNLREQHIL